MNTEQDTTRDQFNAEQAEALKNLAEHPYFLFLVQQEVETRTRAQLGWWWKFMGGVLGVILAAFSFIGYREVADLSAKKDALEKTMKEVATSADAAKDQINQDVTTTKKAVDDISAANVEAQRHITEGKEGSRMLIAQEREAIQDLVNRLFSNYERVQSTYHNQNESILKKITAEGKEATKEVDESLKGVQTTINENKNIIASLEAEKKNMADLIARSKDELLEIQKQGELARTLKAVEGDLMKAGAFEFVFLNAHDSKEIQVYNPNDPAQPFKIKLNSNGLVNNFLKLSIMVEGQPTQSETSLPRGTKLRIEGTKGAGLYVETVAVRHVKFGHDFAILKVYYPVRLVPHQLQTASVK